MYMYFVHTYIVNYIDFNKGTTPSPSSLLPSHLLLCQLVMTVGINGSEPYRELRIQLGTQGPKLYGKRRMQSSTPRPEPTPGHDRMPVRMPEYM